MAGLSDGPLGRSLDKHMVLFVNLQKRCQQKRVQKVMRALGRLIINNSWITSAFKGRVEWFIPLSVLISSHLPCISALSAM